MGRTIGIIQARMGSTRLPKKVMRDIGPEPMLWHVYERARYASLIDRVVIATSTEPEDDAIEDFCNIRDIPCYRGSEEDVLDRYYQVARTEEADPIIRLTADCPLQSPAVIDRVIRTFSNSSAQYVSNTIEYTYPNGLDVEVIDFSSLEYAWNNADTPRDREHVTLLLKQSDEVETKNVRSNIDTSEYTYVSRDKTLRWTVDYPEDLEFVRRVYDRLTQSGHWIFDQHSIFELLEREPALRNINEDR